MANLESEDFTRLQNQLLDLREKNYSLEDSLRKHKKELIETRVRYKSLEEENGRYQVLVKTSRKASEVELLVRDNGYLRNKLRDQEEDFRLQNNTLLQELSRLVGENERYERQVELLCGKTTQQDDNGDTSDDAKEVLRLRGELAAIESKLFEAESKGEASEAAMLEKVTALNLQVVQLSNILKTHSIPVDEGEISLSQGGGVSFKKLSLQDDDGLETTIDTNPESVKRLQDKTGELQHTLEDAQARLRDEQDTTARLQAQNHALAGDLSHANQRLSDALAQAERKASELEQKKLEEMEKTLNETESKFRRELSSVEGELNATKESLRERTAKCDELSSIVQQLNQTVQHASTKQHQSDRVIEEKEQQIKDLEENVKSSNDEIKQLKSDKDQLTKHNEEHCKKIQELTTSLESQSTKLEEMTKLAEGRGGVIEEMRSHLAEETQRHEAQVAEASQRHHDQLAARDEHARELQEQIQSANEKLKEVTDLQDRLSTAELNKSDLQEAKTRLQEELEAAQRHAQEELNRVSAEKIQEMEDLKETFDAEKKDLQTQLEISTIQRQESDEIVETLRRKVSDCEEEQRIHERKGLTLLKDLKKQLAVERKRADRLQEKLSQLLQDPAQLTAITTMSEGGDDVSSVSSWSMVSGEPRDASTRENSIIVSPQGSPPPGTLTEETASLVNRLTEVQQQKWQLEERITHLEASCSAMADDLLKKSALIQHYCMEQKAESSPPTPSSPSTPNLGDKLGVRRMLEAVRGEESSKEINRRLQCLLEETLAKNMRLHKDVDNLSQQVHQLSLLAAKNTQEPAVEEVQSK